MGNLWISRWAIVSAMVVVAPVARSQEAVAFGGLSARGGVVSPTRADAGFGWMVEIDLGYLRNPGLRTFVGFGGFGADVDRVVGGSPVGGSYTATGIHGGLRLDLFEAQRFTPFLSASVMVHNVSADVPDPATDELLDGVYAGAALGGGMAYGLNTTGTIALTAEARRAFITNVGHWAIEAGIRYLPRRTVVR